MTGPYSPISGVDAGTSTNRQAPPRWRRLLWCGLSAACPCRGRRSALSLVRRHTLELDLPSTFRRLNVGRLNRDASPSSPPRTFTANLTRVRRYSLDHIFLSEVG